MATLPYGRGALPNQQLQQESWDSRKRAKVQISALKISSKREDNTGVYHAAYGELVRAEPEGTDIVVLLPKASEAPGQSGVVKHLGSAYTVIVRGGVGELFDEDTTEYPLQAHHIDAIRGEIIQTSPNDTIMATEKGMGMTININGPIYGINATDISRALKKELGTKISI